MELLPDGTCRPPLLVVETKSMVSARDAVDLADAIAVRTLCRPIEEQHRLIHEIKGTAGSPSFFYSAVVHYWAT